MLFHLGESEKIYHWESATALSCYVGKSTIIVLGHTLSRLICYCLYIPNIWFISKMWMYVCMSCTCVHLHAWRLSEQLVSSTSKGCFMYDYLANPKKCILRVSDWNKIKQWETVLRRSSETWDWTMDYSWCVQVCSACTSPQMSAAKATLT